MSIEDSITFLKPGYVTLREWNIIVIQEPNEETSEIFLGFSVSDNIGRMSTAILKYDDKTGVGETRSGSRYQTIGKPGMPHDDAIYVLESIVGEEMAAKVVLTINGEAGGVVSFKYTI